MRFSKTASGHFAPQILILIALTASTLWTVLAQTIDEVTIPRKTEVFITLEKSISTRTAAVGDKFFGQVSVPITQNDKIVVPVGSYIIGHVDSIRRAPRVKGQGELTLRFDTVILPDGTTREMRAAVSSAEGYETDKTSEEGKIQASGESTEDTAKGTAAGAATGGTIGSIAGRSWKGAGIGAGIGAATGAVVGILKRNKEVMLPKGSSVTIILDNDIRFVRPAPVKTGEKLTEK